MASRRSKKARAPYKKKKSAERSKKDTKGNDELNEVPTKRAYVVYGSLLVVFVIFNFISIANNNIFLILVSFLAMLYAMNRLVYVYVLRKRLSGGSPEPKSRY
jgi:hypothetical protein